MDVSTSVAIASVAPCCGGGLRSSTFVDICGSGGGGGGGCG